MPNLNFLNYKHRSKLTSEELASRLRGHKKTAHYGKEDSSCEACQSLRKALDQKKIPTDKVK